MVECIRILRVVGRMDRGGLETIIMNTYRTIERDQMQFDFVMHTNDECAYCEEIRSLGGRIFHAPKYRVWNHFEYVRFWKQFLRQHPEYKVIHGHVRSTASIYLWVAKTYGLVTIAHSHNTSSGNDIKAMIRTILQIWIKKHADYLLACSIPAGQWLFGVSVGDLSNFYVVPNGINSQRFAYNRAERNKYRSEFNINEGTILIGNVARFHEQKNHIFLLNVFAQYLHTQPNAQLLLVGDGALKSEIQSSASKLFVSDKIIFTGSRSDVQGFLHAMDVFVFPSVYEGFGNAVVEAQAAGLPVIASDRVPQEVKITNLVTFVSLDAPISEWVAAIDCALKTKHRAITTDQICGAGFDVQSVAAWYFDFYQRLHTLNGAT